MGNLLVAATGALALVAAPLVAISVGSMAVRGPWPEAGIVGGAAIALIGVASMLARLPRALGKVEQLPS